MKTPHRIFFLINNRYYTICTLFSSFLPHNSFMNFYYRFLFFLFIFPLLFLQDCKLIKYEEMK